MKLADLSVRGIAMRLFLTCWLVYALHFATNIVREIYPAITLGDSFTFDVSPYLGLHPDIFEISGRGAFINNNPGASILGAIPYTIARPVIDRVYLTIQQERMANPELNHPEYDTYARNSREFYLKVYPLAWDIKFGLAAGVIQFFLMAPLSALSVVAMFLVLDRLVASRKAALWLALLYAFATPIFYRTAYLNQNLLLGHFGFFAFLLLWRPWTDDKTLTPRTFFLTGLLLGWTVLFDYSAVVLVLAFGLYALYRWAASPGGEKSVAALLALGSGILIPVMTLLIYQWVNFGHPLYPPQRYMPPTRFSVYGYNGMDWPRLDLLWMTTFGYQFGFFTSAPLMFLALYPRAWLDKRLRLVGRPEALFFAGFTIAFFLFSSANQFGRVQYNTGVRYVVPITPFMFLIVAGVLLRMPKTLAIVFGLLTTYWSWCLTMYREVGYGMGILEAVYRVTFEGLRLPWLTTFERTGYVPQGELAVPILGITGLVILSLWALRIHRRKTHLPKLATPERDYAT